MWYFLGGLFLGANVSLIVYALLWASVDDRCMREQCAERLR